MPPPTDAGLHCNVHVVALLAVGGFCEPVALRVGFDHAEQLGPRPCGQRVVDVGREGAAQCGLQVTDLRRVGAVLVGELVAVLGEQRSQHWNRASFPLRCLRGRQPLHLHVVVQHRAMERGDVAAALLDCWACCQRGVGRFAGGKPDRCLEGFPAMKGQWLDDVAESGPVDGYPAAAVVGFAECAVQPDVLPQRASVVDVLKAAAEGVACAEGFAERLGGVPSVDEQGSPQAEPGSEFSTGHLNKSRILRAMRAGTAPVSRHHH